MKNLFQLVTAASVLTLTAGAVAEPAAESNPPPIQMAKKLTFKKSQTLKVNYLLFLPKDYDARPRKKWPLILFLHGAGERGTNVWKVATHGPPKRVAEHPDFPFIVVSPQCPAGQLWSEDVLLGLLDETIRKYAVDKTRIYLTGLSMGGYASWDLGLTHPERFAAIVPICGGGEFITVLLAGGEQAEALKTLGVWAFHGGKDPVVPTEESQRMVDLLKKFGVQDVNLTVYPEAGHDAWTETYNNPQLYEWLLKHQRLSGRR
ncbi:MAG TPA: prolyl oligopeptidase family serine peptidase [Candidatus Acidoferrum sp.]|jgi:predicted peptidase|nr:prolyl oligopeptidase family serine peptidase [Candidatus Acidoferrum sp.]